MTPNLPTYHRASSSRVPACPSRPFAATSAMAVFPSLNRVAIVAECSSQLRHSPGYLTSVTSSNTTSHATCRLQRRPLGRRTNEYQAEHRYGDRNSKSMPRKLILELVQSCPYARRRVHCNRSSKLHSAGRNSLGIAARLTRTKSLETLKVYVLTHCPSLKRKRALPH
jgi:hypothetical protein